MGVWKKQKTFRITRDLMRLLQKEHLLIFQSTLPDPRSRAQVTAIARFQSTLPERGETLLPFSPARRGEVFQSTLPAWGETGFVHVSVLFPLISIHSPRMGRDRNLGRLLRARQGFQSTLPAWGETICSRVMDFDMLNFNPLSPHGERRDPDSVVLPARRFQSTLPAWGETLNMLM